MNKEQEEKWYNSFTKEQLIERCEYLQRSCERKEDTIVDREMEIADLEKGYCELKEKCSKGECDCTHEEYNNMCEANIKLDLKIERLKEYSIELENRIDEINNLNEKISLALESAEYRLDKAKKYLEEHTDKLKTTRIPKIDFNYNDLLNILQGSDKE